MTDRKPLHVKCEDCKHVWVLLYLPMELDRAARVMSGAHCPQCGDKMIVLATEHDIDVAGWKAGRHD